MKLKDVTVGRLLKLTAIYLAWTAWAYGLLFYCLTKIAAGKGFEAFHLGNVFVPKFYATTYLEVAVLAVAVVVAVGVGFYLRYVQYDEELQIIKQYNMQKERGMIDDSLQEGEGKLGK